MAFFTTRRAPRRSKGLQSASNTEPLQEQAPHPVKALHRALGNQAVQRLADDDVSPHPAAATTPTPSGNTTFPSSGMTPEGRPLPESLRPHFEARFGENFGGVRLHTDASDVAAQGASALTRGRQIAFAPGEWNEGTAAGQRLLAHELAHVAQQARRGSPLSPEGAEQGAERAASGDAARQFGTVPFGTPAAAPADAPAPAIQDQVVPAAMVEIFAAEVERVVASANLPGVDPAAIAEVVAALRAYGNAGKVVWGDTGGAYGEYDPDTDTIKLSATRFNIRDPGPVAAVAVFHEASHATRWRIGGVLAGADYALDLSRRPTESGNIKALINQRLKLYREETLAHTVDRQLLYSYYVDLKINTQQDAARGLASFDPTTGQSAEDVHDEIRELLIAYGNAMGREVAIDRFLADMRTFALTGTDMPDVDRYL